MGRINSKKEKKQKKKLPFGRNLFTLIFVAVVFVVVAFVVSTITSYVSASSKSKYTPFVTKSFSDGTATDYDDDTFLTVDSRMKYTDFDTFGVSLKCSSYFEYDDDSTSRTAEYIVALYKNDNTPSIKNGSVNVSLCMAAPWVGFIKYPSSYSPRSLEFCESKDNATSSSPDNYKKFSFSGQIDFPAKVSTFPIPITVEYPTIYLYLSYTDAYSKTKTVVLEYSYKNLVPQNGGILK